jgi:hypothetical protein
VGSAGGHYHKTAPSVGLNPEKLQNHSCDDSPYGSEKCLSIQAGYPYELLLMSCSAISSEAGSSTSLIHSAKTVNRLFSGPNASKASVQASMAFPAPARR